MPVTLLTIDPTGDVIASPRHAELKERASAFAKRYNALLIRYFDRTGRRHCPTSERWDDYWNALNALANRIPGRWKSFVIAKVEIGPDKPDFLLHVQEEQELSTGLYARMCALARHFGITRVQFDVTTGNINNNPKHHPPFSCVRGSVAG